MPSIFRRNLSFFYRKGDDVTVYPVPADQIAAYLDADQAGTTIRGLFHVDDVLVTDGEIPIEDVETVFETLETTADAQAMKARTHSIVFDGSKYNILSRRPKDPGFVEFPLELYVG